MRSSDCHGAGPASGEPDDSVRALDNLALPVVKNSGVARFSELVELGKNSLVSELEKDLKEEVWKRETQ